MDQLTYLRELCIKEQKHFKVYDHFRPKFNETLITRKFYSPYESLAFVVADPELVAQAKKVYEWGPRELYRRSQTDNQNYGWHLDYFLDKSAQFSYPRRSSEYIKHELRIQVDSKQDKKFIGIPFRY